MVTRLGKGSYVELVQVFFCAKGPCYWVEFDIAGGLRSVVTCVARPRDRCLSAACTLSAPKASLTGLGV